MKISHIAQVCENGHLITASAATHHELTQHFCSECGAPTIWKCPQCGQVVRGITVVTGVISTYSDYTVPKFCPSCGAPYPWTARALETAKSLASEFEGLSAEEREALSKTIDDLVEGGPRTELAAVRFKKMVPKLGAQATQILQKVLVEIVSESVKKTLMGT